MLSWQLLDRAGIVLHSHQRDILSLIFQILQSGKWYFIFLNGHRNTKQLHKIFVEKMCSKQLYHKVLFAMASTLVGHGHDATLSRGD